MPPALRAVMAMDTRRTTELIELRRPFVVKSRRGTLPSGHYVIEVHEERLEGLSYPPWRRSGMTIGLAGAEAREKLSLTPGELADLLSADAEP